MMEEFYLDHRSQPLWGTKFYRCVVWLVADVSRLKLIEYVRYYLHPTFRSEFTESKDYSTGFRTILDCWGSFYMKASIFFKSGKRIDLDYYLDHKQIFPRKQEPTIKSINDSSFNEKELLKHIEDGVSTFKNVDVSKTIHQDLYGKELTGIKFEDTRFNEISFRGVNLSGSLFTDCQFIECDFTAIKSEGTQYLYCDFSRSTLHPKSFISSKLEKISADQIRLPDNPSELFPNDRVFAENEFENWVNNIIQRVNDMSAVQSPPKVFLCHANEDKERVEALYDALNRYGIKVWFDQKDLNIGDNWRRKIRKAIKDTDFFAVCLSKNAVGKTGFINNEIRTAVDEYQRRSFDSVFFLPIRLEECETPDIDLGANTFFEDLQWNDVFEGDEKAEETLAEKILEQWKRAHQESHD